MKNKSDFSKGELGKFYTKSVKMLHDGKEIEYTDGPDDIDWDALKIVEDFLAPPDR